MNLPNEAIWRPYTYEVEHLAEGTLIQVKVDGKVRDLDVVKLREEGWVTNNHRVFTKSVEVVEAPKVEREIEEEYEVHDYKSLKVSEEVEDDEEKSEEV